MCSLPPRSTHRCGADATGHGQATHCRRRRPRACPLRRAEPILGPWPVPCRAGLF